MWNKLESKIIYIFVIIVAMKPAITWIINSIKIDKFAVNTYTISDIYLLFIFSSLAIIVNKIQKTEDIKITGDESKIISNRNQSNYAEIWDACNDISSIEIEAYGHSFKTLWNTFIKKLLFQIQSKNTTNYTTIKITLVATKDDNCFSDIEIFYNKLDEEFKKVISFNLILDESFSFFTGISVNKKFLWLSVREPQSATKENEHVREWINNKNETSKKMLLWFSGMIDYYSHNNTNKLELKQ